MIEGARHEILQEQDVYRAQFWAAFDAFVPGASCDSSGGVPERQFRVRAHKASCGQATPRWYPDQQSRPVGRDP